jgi:hypothetical protein
MSRIRTTESRPYDAYFDANYISNTAGMDRRVASSVSRTDTVAGTSRYKYFRRPVMPRMSAVPPQILLAPTEAVDPLVPCEEEPEPTVKDMEIQTMYRESEAQTNPYTPDFFVAPGAAPEVLLLKDLNLGDNQGGLGMKQVEMIENARRKRDVESNLPPFTDEAGLRLRKRLMEIQEMKEFRMREGEIDTRREARMEAIEQALRDRDESAEFLASQRVEGLRLLRMEEREKTLMKIRDKRIKVLRRLALRRNQVNPRLSSSDGPDVINDYFDKGSSVYAPIKRKGELTMRDGSAFDVLSRTAPLGSVQNINDLEDFAAHSTVRSLDDDACDVVMTREGAGLKGKQQDLGPRASQPRLTSSSLRALRNRKKDIEVMTRILTMRKIERAGGIKSAPHTPHASHAAMSASAPAEMFGAENQVGDAANRPRSNASGGGIKKLKGRPVTPDFTRMASNGDAGTAVEDDVLSVQLVLLQRLLRGRAVQNTMYEGRYRRRELINEMRVADAVNDVSEDVRREMARIEGESVASDRMDAIRRTTVDFVAGHTSSNLLAGLLNQKQREHIAEQMLTRVRELQEERRYLEAQESGRRQREMMNLPDGFDHDIDGDDEDETAQIVVDEMLLDKRYTVEETAERLATEAEEKSKEQNEEGEEKEATEGQIEGPEGG